MEEGDISQLPNMIVQWKQTQEEIKKLKEQIRELNIREKAYSDVIMRVMKKNSIGTLDLQQSQRRIVYNKKEKRKGISVKQLGGQLTEFLKSEEQGKSAMEFLLGKRAVKSVETLVLEAL